MLNIDRLNKIIIIIPKKIYKIILLFLFLIDAIGLNLASLLKKIEILDIAASYNSLTALCPPITHISQKYLAIFLILTVFTIVLLLYRPKLLLIKHISFSLDIADIKQDIFKKYYIKKTDINQCDEMKKIDTIVNAITIQDQVVKSILRNRKSASLCYYGIAHTPLIFRMGFLFGDQNNIMLLHKTRTNDSLFNEWSNNNVYSAITSHESNQSLSSSELIVLISTSFRINYRELESLHPENKHILSFESTIISFDSILSYTQAENYRNTIMIAIRKCAKEYAIQKVHIVISSSVAFTFFLGQAFSSQHDPITIVYHYQNGTYPWGICINEPGEKALVINNTLKNSI